MFAIVILLTEPKALVVVPISWISSLDIVQIFNIGVSHTKKHRLFFSLNRDDDPNFRLPLKKNLDPDIPANYEGKILSVWRTYKDACDHMASRRHVLPAIYNANLERFHFDFHAQQAADLVKQEQIEGVIWLNGNEIIDLVEDNELIEDGEGAAHIPNIVGNNEHIEDGEGVAMENDVDDVKRVIVFPDIRNIIFDLTENDELIRYVIAFSGNDIEHEKDCEFSWTEEFAQPILSIKAEKDDIDPEDEILGSLKFTIDSQNGNERTIEIGGTFIKMKETLYNLLGTFMNRENYHSHYFDARFVVILIASYVRKNEANTLDPEDPRIQMIREIFYHRVQHDPERVRWFENRIADNKNLFPVKDEDPVV